MTSNYYKLPFSCQSAQSLLERAESTSFWRSYFNFSAIRVRNRELEKDKFFANLYCRFPYKAAILKLEPYQYYNWHVDIRRGVSVNMLLNFDAHSHTMFSKDYGNIISTFDLLDYEYSACYLFNNKVYHTVFNFDKPRYLFSLEFDNKELSYDELLKIIINEEIKY